MKSVSEAINLCSKRSIFYDAHEKDICLRELNKLLQLYEENQDFLVECFQKDYNTEAYFFDILYLIEDVKKTIKHFDERNKTQRFFDGVLQRKIITIASQPLGSILIVAEGNFPLYFALMPVASAISSGNRVIIRPSEVAPITTKAFDELLGKYVNPNRCQLVLGGSSVLEELLAYPFDHIMHMGGSEMAQKIHAAANRNLIPTTFLLNGKSPVYIDESVDLEVATRRLMWKKFCHLSESCITPDYLLCNTIVRDRLVPIAQKILNEMYVLGQKSSFQVRSYSEEKFNHLKGLLKRTKGRIVVGGNVDEKERRISPTIVIDVDENDPLVKEEICGPILPIVKAITVADALYFVHTTKPSPLVAYAFTSRRAAQITLMMHLKSACVYFNDMVSPTTDKSNGSVQTTEFRAISNKEAFNLFTSDTIAFRQSLISPTEHFGQICMKIFDFIKSHKNSMVLPYKNNFFDDLSTMKSIKIMTMFIFVLILVLGINNAVQ